MVILITQISNNFFKLYLHIAVVQCTLDHLGVKFSVCGLSALKK